MSDIDRTSLLGVSLLWTYNELTVDGLTRYCISNYNRASYVAVHVCVWQSTRS